MKSIGAGVLLLLKYDLGAMPWTPLASIDPGEHSNRTHVRASLSDAGAFGDAKHDMPRVLKDLLENNKLSGVLDGSQAIENVVKDSRDAMGKNVEDHQYMNTEFLPKSENAVIENQRYIDQEQHSVNYERQQLQQENGEIQKDWDELATNRKISQDERDQQTEKLYDRQSSADQKTLALDERQKDLDVKQEGLDRVQHNIDSWHLATTNSQDKSDYAKETRLHQEQGHSHQKEAFEHKSEANEDLQTERHHEETRKKHGQLVELRREQRNHEEGYSQGY